MSEGRDWNAKGKRRGEDSPARLKVEGEVDVPNPGAEAELVEAPTGINPDYQMLRVVVTQRDGGWPQEITPRKVKWKGDVSPTTTDVHVIDYAQIKVDWE
ncbi:hypothetical protein NQ152_00210 [Microbacterium sp. zg.B48]|uniref:hypothetical protein n=1 Tax=Microbacterium sp. zg.B48 TaxID=2969408 RepID=UPI00214AA393|nr:hypothetical protein [Microbacterium sp. zg.B48]MCR2761926.1 hypothetical protein [Microbacterium sp. zg.B48]